MSRKGSDILHKREMAISAYNSLRDLFEINQHRHLEIEILPSAIQPPDGQLYLEDNACVGIPKQTLILAFQVARSTFAAAHADDSSFDSKGVIQSTSVILLYDPEHLTAANYRKRRLLTILDHSPELIPENLRAELNFLSSILTSPLHRQSKSPTLWYHRWWLISVFLPSIEDMFPRHVIFKTSTPQADLMNLELECILKAGERHPNNYYAWQHARRITALEAKSAAGTEQDLKALLDRILQWCLRNPSDTSGWSFLLHLLGMPGMAPSDTAAVLNSVLTFATQLQWQKEALWVFVRAALGPQNPTAKEYRAAQLNTVRQLVKHHGVQIPRFGEANPCCADTQDGYWGDLEDLVA